MAAWFSSRQANEGIYSLLCVQGRDRNRFSTCWSLLIQNKGGLDSHSLRDGIDETPDQPPSIDFDDSRRRQRGSSAYPYYVVPEYNPLISLISLISTISRVWLKRSWWSSTLLPLDLRYAWESFPTFWRNLVPWIIKGKYEKIIIMFLLKVCRHGSLCSQ